MNYATGRGRLGGLLVVVITMFAIYEGEASGEESNSDVAIDSHLVGQIRLAHERLVRDVSSLSGRIEQWRGSLGAGEANLFSVDDLKRSRQIQFYVSGTSVRLEYLNHRPGTEILPDHRNNDITQVLIQRKDLALDYMATPTTGVPYATVYRYSDPQSPQVALRLQTDLKSWLSALTAVGGTPILNFLQRPLVSLEKRSYGDISNALRIAGQDRSDDGQSTSWELILDIDNYYALRRCLISTKATNCSASVRTEVRVAKVSNSVVIPGEIAVIANVGSPQSYREVTQIRIDSVTAPKPRVFLEKSLALLSRDYTIVDVDRNGQKRTGQLTMAAPGAARQPPGGSGMRMIGTNGRLGALVAITGVVCVLVGVLLYRQIRRRERRT